MLYRGGIELAGSPDPEKLIENTFAANGWGHMWRNGIYAYVHYHSMIHEALGIARGRATVRFGGDHGAEIEVAPGDVTILPAGTGHQCLAQTPDLVVIGAYPSSGKYNLCRGTRAEHARALAAIRKVPTPATDPYSDPTDRCPRCGGHDGALRTRRRGRHAIGNRTRQLCFWPTVSAMVAPRVPSGLSWPTVESCAV